MGAITTIINLILIQAIICYIVDISGVMDSIKSLINRLIFKGKANPLSIRVKPFDCSLCMMFWVGNVTILLQNNFTLPYIALVCLLSMTASDMTGLLRWGKDVLVKIQDLLYKLIGG